MATKLKSKSNVALIILAAASLVAYIGYSLVDMSSFVLAFLKGIHLPTEVLCSSLFSAVLGGIPYVVMLVYAIVRSKSYKTDALLKVYYVLSLGLTLYINWPFIQISLSSLRDGAAWTADMFWVILSLILYAIPVVAVLFNSKNRLFVAPIVAYQVVNGVLLTVSGIQSSFLLTAGVDWMQLMFAVAFIAVLWLLVPLLCATVLLAGLGRTPPVEAVRVEELQPEDLWK